MLCEMCKVNEATVHILEDVNGTKKEVHLCLSCAGKKAFGHAVLGGMDLSGVLESLEKNLGESGLSLFKRDASDETETPLPPSPVQFVPGPRNSCGKRVSPDAPNVMSPSVMN